MTKQEQYVSFLDRLPKILEVGHDMSVIADSFVIAAFWSQRGEIDWTQRWRDTDNWNLLDETVMLVDALPSYGYPLLISREHLRRIGMFFLNLPDDTMKPGTGRRWGDRCDWIKKQSKFYEHELFYASRLRREHEKFLLAMSSKENLLS